MLFSYFNLAKESIVPIDTTKYLDDVVLAETLLANASQNGGALSSADIVFSLRNFLRVV
jgi:hypothetical protein